jgi:hypothetical protein
MWKVEGYHYVSVPGESFLNIKQPENTKFYAWRGKCGRNNIPKSHSNVN